MQLVHHVWFQPLLQCLFLLLPTLSYAFPITLPLERAFPQSQRVNMSDLRARDRERHRRILQSSNGVVNFHVFGNADSYKYGLYFTKVKLGSPPREFNLQIDTGSDILWVSCNACADCPRSSRLGIPLGLYNSDTSSSASLVSCSDQACALAMQSTDSGCNTQNSLCSYSVEYADGSGTSGYYVKDIMQLETIVEDSSNANSSAFVIFGCSNYQSGDLTKSDAAVDGIFGFGQHEMSIISQLSSRGVVPKIFSHCLRGDVDGGGILVLGEILEPDIVYSPLVPSQYHYNLNLQSISINGKNLPIDPAVFATSINRGTIVDSGTTLAFLVEEAYDPFVSSLIDAVSQSSHAVFSAEKQCFQLSSRVVWIHGALAFRDYKTRRF